MANFRTDSRILNLPPLDRGAIIKTHIRRAIIDKHIYTIQIRDCHSSICLHGSLHSELGYKNAYHKIDTLINSLTALKERIKTKEKIHQNNG